MRRADTTSQLMGVAVALLAVYAVAQTFGFARDQHRNGASPQRISIPQVRVPDVRGLSVRAAEEALAARMLYVRHVRPQAAPGHRRATVIAQNPPPRTVRPGDSPVTLTVLTDRRQTYPFVRSSRPLGPRPVPR